MNDFKFMILCLFFYKLSLNFSLKLISYFLGNVNLAQLSIEIYLDEFALLMESQWTKRLSEMI